MSFRIVLTLLLILVLACAGLIQAQETEQDIVNRYLTKSKKMNSSKLGWVSFSYSNNRVNRSNDYNTLVGNFSNQMPGTSFDWIGNTSAVGVEFGTIFKKKFAWSVGAEYWLKAGQANAGNYTYTPPSGNTVIVSDPKSEVKVWGVSTSAQYYFYNNPVVVDHLQELSIRGGFSIGYYFASWDMFNEYQNVNLQTATAENQNITFKGTAPAFAVNVGAEYPTSLMGIAFGLDVSYLYLNFKNMAWYNAQDDEIVPTLDGTESGRVDLNLSGIRGKVELKKYFSW